mgnify:CR=1 FL=1|tara:strand:+ start:503 stop:838 length:336 start_codon:yes stop_codon:yes gene_type:complete
MENLNPVLTKINTKDCLITIDDYREYIDFINIKNQYNANGRNIMKEISTDIFNNQPFYIKVCYEKSITWLNYTTEGKLNRYVDAQGHYIVVDRDNKVDSNLPKVMKDLICN